MQDELIKRIEKLEIQIKELKKDNLSMFGRTYHQAGSSNSDFLIKTRGQVKIQWGSKFIDLIKDGKLNVDSNIIHTVDSESQIDSEGLYLTKEGAVYFKTHDNPPINLNEKGNSYVSFLEEQETDSNSKYNALKNIGFVYPSMEVIDENSLKNGIIYIESEKKLFIVQNGVLSDFSINFPNPLTEQFIIQKKDSTTGALVIKGSGLSNSVAFDSMYLYTDMDNSYIKAEESLLINIKNDRKVAVTQNKTSIYNTLEVNNLQSQGTNLNQGYQIFLNDKGATLLIDNVTIRNSELGISENIPEQARYGLYACQGYFDNIAYTTSECLLDDENSTKLASTEWVRKVLANPLPIGSIIAFHGETIPEGWAICDGNNGTPNLIGKFVMGDNIEREGNKITISSSNISEGVNSSIVEINPTYYSLVFIMKIK